MPSFVSHDSFMLMSHIAHMNAACRTHDRVTSIARTRHSIYINSSCHADQSYTLEHSYLIFPPFQLVSERGEEIAHAHTQTRTETSTRHDNEKACLRGIWGYFSECSGLAEMIVFTGDSQDENNSDITPPPICDSVSLWHKDYCRRQ